MSSSEIWVRYQFSHDTLVLRLLRERCCYLIKKPRVATVSKFVHFNLDYAACVTISTITLKSITLSRRDGIVMSLFPCLLACTTFGMLLDITYHISHETSLRNDSDQRLSRQRLTQYSTFVNTTLQSTSTYNFLSPSPQDIGSRSVIGQTRSWLARFYCASDPSDHLNI